MTASPPKVSRPSGAVVGFTGSAPSRIVPPMSVTSFCSGSRSITGCRVSGSNSDELAPSKPAAWRANSTTAICIPRQIPRNRIPFSRAIRAASTLPSIPARRTRRGQDPVSGLEVVRVGVLGFTSATSTSAPWW